MGSVLIFQQSFPAPWLISLELVEYYDYRCGTLYCFENFVS